MAFEGGFGSGLGGTWEHLRHMGVALGLLWVYFGISLGSVWVSVGDFGSLDAHFAMIVESVWVYERPFSKLILPIEPHRFE